MKLYDAFLYESSVPVVGIAGLCVVMFLCLLYAIKRVFAKKKISAFLYEITILINNKKAVLNGFLDTGNTLVGKSGKPVVMVPEKLLKNFFNSEEMLDLVADLKNSITDKYSVVTVKFAELETSLLPP